VEPLSQNATLNILTETSAALRNASVQGNALLNLALKNATPVTRSNPLKSNVDVNNIRNAAPRNHVFPSAARALKTVIESNLVLLAIVIALPNASLVRQNATSIALRTVVAR